MSRKSVLMGTGTLLLFGVAVIAALLLLLLREPGFYRRVAVPPGPRREEQSRQFFTRFWAFLEDVHERRVWDATFTQDQVNSFLDHEFVLSNLDRQVLPEGISEPRVALDADRLRLAFRYHVGRWSTVISIDMRVWLAAAEPNVIALELRGMRAGSLPVSAQSLLERLTDAADRNNIKMSWYRHQGNPVAILRFQGDQPRSSAMQLDCLALQPGQVVVHGQATEPGTPTPALPETAPPGNP